MSAAEYLGKVKILTEVEHILKRPARYVGSTTPEASPQYLITDGKATRETITFVPATIKIFDEIITNSRDFSLTPEGKHMKTIRVDVNPMLGSISVYDDGGIPVLKHPEYKAWIPEILLGRVRAGTNFDDKSDSESAGQNGEGAALTNIFSTEFKVETADGKKRFEMTFSDNMHKKSEAVISACPLKYTRITYMPDQEALNFDFDRAFVKLIERRVYEIAASAPHLDVYYNGKVIQMTSFEHYVGLFTDSYVYEQTPNWRMAIAKASEDSGFEQFSFVNSTSTYNGGTHVEYVMEQVISGIRGHIEKKTKVKLKPSDIRNHLRLFLDCTINNPRYNSQTKDNLITPVSLYGAPYKVSEKFIKKLLATDIVKEIIEWAERRQKADLLAEARAKAKLENKNDLADIVKYEPANSNNPAEKILILAEGDSAANPIIATRNTDKHGVFPMRGASISAMGNELKKIVNNVEVTNICKILGVAVGKKYHLEDLRYHTVLVATDADKDGAHIRGLITCFFWVFWPQFVKEGRLKFLITPVFKVTTSKGEVLEFFTTEEYEVWAKKGIKHTHVYLKGLGSNELEDFTRYLNDQKYWETMEVLDEADEAAITLAFHPDMADDRKVWLEGCTILTEAP
uniref:DNA topoisomerase 2 n=1 Tax=Pseudomonas phage Cygsa01 TaxID=3138529 RepID=A0AAU6W3N3_9VIRU